MAYSQKNNYRHSYIDQKPKPRKIRKKFSTRKMSRFILWGLIIYMCFSLSQGFYQGYKLKQEINTLEKQLSIVKTENTELLDEFEYIQTPEAIEKIAREKLGLIKPGEIVIMKAREAQP
ncbi:MAG: FtsB family cell division protein [Peptococcaceae bacterium]